MKKFYDREQEKARLLDMQQQSYKDYSRFVVLTGRNVLSEPSLAHRLYVMKYVIISSAFGSGTSTSIPIS